MEPKDIKNEVAKGLEKIDTLRDEIRLRMHLASMDAKTEWNEKLEPRVFDVESSARELTDASRAAVKELVERLEQFALRLRSGGPTPRGA